MAISIETDAQAADLLNKPVFVDSPRGGICSTISSIFYKKGVKDFNGDTKIYQVRLLISGRVYKPESVTLVVQNKEDEGEGQLPVRLAVVLFGLGFGLACALFYILFRIMI